MDRSLQQFTKLDAALVKISKNIKILSTLAWRPKLQTIFLEGWEKGNPALPRVTYPKLDFNDSIEALQSIKEKAAGDHPIAVYLRATAQSYIDAALMLTHMGGPRMTEHGIALYGKPGDVLKGGKITNIDAARYFIEIANDTSRQFDFDTGDYCLTAQSLKSQLDADIKPFFTKHEVGVVIDPALASKAAAGPRRIRLRDATCFTPFDHGQLLQHEVFVHSLTALNGLDQPHLGSMGLGAPRTTATQEGLATFAELVTGVIDLSRLKRIALRILAVDMALNKADFIEVFRFFLESGQSQTESYNSTMRIFRGGDPRGKGVVFTKDAVYLQGLIAAHTFFRWAMRSNHLTYIHHLFSGRLAFDDVMALEPFFENGFIKEATYLPPWLNMRCLGAYLAFSVFSNKINLARVQNDAVGFV